MWRVEESREYAGQAFIYDPDRSRPGNHWPNMKMDRSGYRDIGTCILMCDVFNQRDYPEQFKKETPCS